MYDMYEYFLCMHISVYVHVVSSEARMTFDPNPQTWHYRWLLTVLWVLVIEPQVLYKSSQPVL